MLGSRFTIIIKATWACNMRCLYCYEMNNGYKAPKISLETINKLLYRLSQYGKERGSAVNVRFIWHGGEPLLLGRDFFEKVLELIKDFPNLSVHHSLQTNGTLLDRDWLRFFQNHRFRVGISLDGPQELHDKQRMFLGGRPTFAKIWENLKLLKQFQKSVSVISVVTKITLDMAEKFYDFFTMHRIPVKLSPLIPPKGMKIQGVESNLSIEPEEYGEFLVYIFNRWVSEPEYTIRIDPLFDMIRSLITGSSNICTFKGECYKFLAVEPDGSITICGRWDASDISLGNVYDNTIDEMYDLLQSRFLKYRKGVYSKCQECRFFSICRGGCSYLGYTRRLKVDDKDYYCEAYKRIFAHIELFLRERNVSKLNLLKPKEVAYVA